MVSNHLMARKYQNLIQKHNTFCIKLILDECLSLALKELKRVCFRCTGNVKTLQLLFSIEDNKAEQVRGL